MDETLKCAIQIETTEQYFPVVMFNTLFNVVQCGQGG